jgi:N-acetylmuramoyl-L-alanine amidase
MADCDAAERVLCSTEYEVSAHYLITTQGDVIQLVEEADRAWHAGAGAWGSVTDVNSRSIGIELSNIGTAPFAASQMDALETLLRGIMDRWSIPPERVIGHSDLAPGRKIDPGARFDWNRLAWQGLAIRAKKSPPAPTNPATFDALLTTIGYPQVPADTRLSAFRLRHRPHHTGPLDGTDMALALDLAKRFPAT